ncbi:MAG: YggS family pyridoxal phosphate-dependent enzyme [Dehalococcoidia bacterium]|nr:YggS family pyridoxal phosphate-dependent enzyme [Dehalococcoidia bacterium]
MNRITENTRRILGELPEGVELLVAGKGRTADELMAAVEGGARIIGQNYVQAAEPAIRAIGNLVQWHFIGHLQRNKAKRAVELFQMIETVDSIELACELDKRCAGIGLIMPVLIEVNSARESRKAGVFPEDVVALTRGIASLPNVRLMGLMTMGPLARAAGECRPFFSGTRRLFDEIDSLALPHVQMKYLSMGMTDTYKIAIREGANIIRIGRGIFGER